jgi:hypothetical protein
MPFHPSQGARSVLRASAVAAVAVAVLATAAWASASGHAQGTVVLSGQGSARPASLAGWASQSSVAGNGSSFSISGRVSGLYPGAVLPLTLTVTNSRSFPIDVTSISAAVGAPGGGCAASNLMVTSFSGQLLVPGQGTRHAVLHVTLRHAAPNPCQGVVFPLSYSGTAVKAA